MNMQDFFSNFMTTFDNIGSIASVLLTLGAFWTAFSKRPREKLKQLTIAVSKEANADVRERQKEISEELKKSKEIDLALLRNAITSIYFKYLDTKKIPHYENENLHSLYSQYEKLGGNSYVKTLVETMEKWEETL